MAALRTRRPALLDRLWGEHGQELLENSHIGLLNATAVGTETLKNLVLPGRTADDAIRVFVTPAHAERSRLRGGFLSLACVTVGPSQVSARLRLWTRTRSAPKTLGATFS